MNAGQPSLLEVVSITKSFGAVRALKGVTFDLRAGEVHALVGENGAGKSTLIKIITGAHRPDAGTIRIKGSPARHLSPATAHKQGIACIYQQPALFPDLTVAENIALRLEPAAPFRLIHWGERRSQAARLLEQIGARISPDTEVRSLSMPEQQLVEIACAVGAEAGIIIMDEPTAALTGQEQERLFGIVRRLRERGAGIIYISHRLEEVFALADRVTVLRDGESLGTRERAGITEAELIQLMVGRELVHARPPAASAPGEVVLSVREVGCRETGVRNVSLDLQAREIFGLAGLVGAGRTELAQILFGITPADSGSLVLGGHEVKVRSPREAVALGIAYVPEDRRRHGVILEMPIAANMTLASQPRVFPGGWLRFDAERLLALDFMRRLHIRAAGPDAPGLALSGGNQQKVAIARWLATQPRVLILDEPTQGVDVAAKAAIHTIIRQLADSGLAVLLISSDLPEVLAMSDRIGVMRRGELTGVLPAGSSAAEVMKLAVGQGSAGT
jgi:rhamnose transport system ATP-binding protein